MTTVLVCVVLGCSRGGHASAPPMRGGQALPETALVAGERMAGERGWVGGEWRCLWRLWDRESHWRWNADNRRSDAYGIPQALPGSKMGPGWQTDFMVQIRWGLRYVAGRYGSPCRAYAHSNVVGYY